MGWEFDGDEDDFWRYCEANTPKNNEDYDYWEQTQEILSSFFLNQLIKSEKLFEQNCLKEQIDFEASEVSEIRDFIIDVYRICFLNKEGRKIDPIQPYYEAIYRNDPEVYESRMKLINQRKELLKSKEYSKLSNLLKKRKVLLEQIEFVLDKIVLKEENILLSINEIISKYKFGESRLLYVFMIATLHIRTEYESEFSWSYSYKEKEIINSNNFNSNNEINPFRLFLCEHTLSETFRELLINLAKYFDYLESSDLKINNTNTISINIQENGIIFTDKDYKINIFTSLYNDKIECFEVNVFFNNISLFKTKLSYKLLPFNFSKKDNDVLKEKQKETNANLRAPFSYSQMISIGEYLVHKYGG